MGAASLNLPTRPTLKELTPIMDDKSFSGIIGNAWTGTQLHNVGAIQVLTMNGPAILETDRVYMWPNGYVTVYQKGKSDDDWTMFGPDAVILIISEATWSQTKAMLERIQDRAVNKIADSLLRMFGMDVPKEGDPRGN